MRARPPQIDWRTYLDASLFPLKIFIVLAVVCLIGWYRCLNVQSPEIGDFYRFANIVAIGYILAGLVLASGGIIQAFCSTRRAAIWSMSFALAGVIIGVCMWNYVGEGQYDSFGLSDAWNALRN